MGFRTSHLVKCHATNLALSNGVHPTGAMLLSINVRRYTVVARSFQGLPRKHLPSVTVLALASGDCWKKHWARHLMIGSRRTYANDPRFGNICTISISRCVSQVGALPGGYPTAARTVGQSDVFEPTGLHSAFLATEKSTEFTYAVPNPNKSGCRISNKAVVCDGGTHSLSARI